MASKKNDESAKSSKSRAKSSARQSTVQSTAQQSAAPVAQTTNSQSYSPPLGPVQINPAYLPAQVAQQIKTAFMDNAQLPNIKLGQILDAKSYAAVRKAIEKVNTHAAIAPLEYHFSMARVHLPPLTTAIDSFTTPIFGELGLSAEWKLISLSWKDYSMLLDTQSTRNGFDVIVDLSDDFPQNAGGDIIYTVGGEENVEIPAAPNTLVLVKIDKKTRAFMRYVNHYGKDHRRLFLVQHLETH